MSLDTIKVSSSDNTETATEKVSGAPEESTIWDHFSKYMKRASFTWNVFLLSRNTSINILFGPFSNDFVEFL